MTPDPAQPAGWWDRFWDEHDSATLARHADHPQQVLWDYTLDRIYEFVETNAPGRRVLECGCGSARVSAHLAERGYQCTLLDYSEGALAVARKRLDSAGVKGHLVRADMMRLPFASDSFDIVFSGGVLQFFSDIQRPVSEIARVLDPGGLFMADMVPPKFSAQTLADVERTLAYGIRNLLRGEFRAALTWVNHLPREYGVQPWSLDDYLRACHRAGLVNQRGRVASPFPTLALPRALQRRYAGVMRAMIPAWRRFDDSTARWTEVLGITYRVNAHKPVERGGIE